MQQHEIDMLLQIAADATQPLSHRRGVCERLDKLNGSLDQGNRHRLEKAQHGVRRDLDMALRERQ